MVIEDGVLRKSAPKSESEANIALSLRASPGSVAAKVSVMFQTLLSNTRPQNDSLATDIAVVAQSATRLLRALAAIAQAGKRFRPMYCCLVLARAVDLRRWPALSPLYQLPTDVSVA